MRRSVQIWADKDFVCRLQNMALVVNREKNIDRRVPMTRLTRLCNKLFDRYEKEVIGLIGKEK